MAGIDQSVLEAILAELERKATNDVVRAKLRNLHGVCKELAKAGIRLSVPAVIQEYRRHHSGKESMGESSIRNKRDKEDPYKNPYNRLFTAWSDWSKLEARSRAKPGAYISDDDLAGIPVHLRHRVGLLMAEAHSLRSRVNILERVNEKQIVVVQGFVPAGEVPPPVAPVVPAPPPSFDEDDIEAVREFLDPVMLRERGLRVGEDRSLTASSAGMIAHPGFLDALERIANAKG